MLVPVYIEVETASGSARVLASGAQAYALRQESVKKELREFVEVVRRVSPDKHLMQQQWKALFQKVTPHAYRTLSLYAQEINPLAIQGERRVEILRVLAQTEQTYDIRWLEIMRQRGRRPPGARHLQWHFYVEQAAARARPVSLDELRANPLGIPAGGVAVESRAMMHPLHLRPPAGRHQV